MNPWTSLLAALGLAVFLEGLPYFLSPTSVRRAMEALSALSDGAMRGVGLVLMVAGLLLAYISLH